MIIEFVISVNFANTTTYKRQNILIVTHDTKDHHLNNLVGYSTRCEPAYTTRNIYQRILLHHEDIQNDKECTANAEPKYCKKSWE